MNFSTIAEIYSANDLAREQLKNTITDLDDEALNFMPDDGGWSVANTVEHIAIVERGVTGICVKLLSKAEAESRGADGSAQLSANFTAKAMEMKDEKFNAPDRVQPTCKQSLSESIEVLDSTRKSLNELRKKFETVEGADFTFPHPAFGEMTAHDWLFLIGAHEVRHTKQIERILSDQNEAKD